MRASSDADVLDPLHGDGYQFWSGIGGAALIPVIYKALGYVWPTRCTQLGCRRRARKATLAGVAFCHEHFVEVAE